jgi:AcrR family transcriptional regulator
MLAAAPDLESLPVRENVVKSLNDQLTSHTHNLPALSQLLGINKTTIWHWYKGKHLLQFGSLLKLCYQLEVPLLDFVMGKVIPKCLMAVTVSSQEEKGSKGSARQRRALNKKEANQILRAALEEAPPPSLQDVAARLGRDANTLRYWYADLCEAIATRYAKYKNACSATRWKEIESILQSFLNEAEPSSMAQIASRLGYSVKTLAKHYPYLCRELSARHAKRRNSNWAELQTKLQTALDEYPPPSVLRLAERLGLSKSSLYKHFPSLCHQIAERYVDYRRHFAAKIRQMSLDPMQQGGI